MCSGFCMTSFAAFAPVVGKVSSYLAQIYGVSEILVGVASELFIFMYVPFNFPFVWLIDRYGIRFSVIAGVLLTTSGTWIRLVIIAQPSFYWILFG